MKSIPMYEISGQPVRINNRPRPQLLAILIISLMLISGRSSNCFNLAGQNLHSDLLWKRTGSIESAMHHEIHLLEDKDYPKSLFEDYTRHVGQVSGITTLPEGDVVIFHRADRHWTEETFNRSNGRVLDEKPEMNLIKGNTIMIIDRDNGSSVASFGKNLFYLPHSIASDSQGNLWISDVGRHQVMRLARPMWSAVATGTDERRQVWPDIILGEAFEPGQDEAHFCQPSEVVVSSDGRLVFVADGYCNKRVKVYSGSGVYLGSFGQEQEMSIVHSLTLIEQRNMLCVADRENERILCFKAGLDGDLQSMGEFLFGMKYPLGKVYALLSINQDYLLVSSKQINSNHYDLALLNPFDHQLKLVWTSSDLSEPHSLAKTSHLDDDDDDDDDKFGMQFVYAADLARNSYKKVFKFDVIQRN